MKFVIDSRYSIAIFLFGVVCSILAFYSVRHDELAIVKQEVTHQLTKINRQIKHSFNQQSFSLQWLADDWDALDNPSELKFNVVTQRLLRSHNALHSISVLDSQRRILYTMPSEASSLLATSNINRNETISDQLDIAFLTGKVVGANMVLDTTDQLSLALFAPLDAKAENAGFIMSVLNLEAFLHNLVSTSLDDGYQLKIVHIDQELLAFYGDKKLRSTWGASLSSNVFNQTWTLSIWPTQTKLNEVDGKVAWRVFWVGFIFSVLLAVLFQLMLQSKRQTRKLKQSNLELEQEVGRRTEMELSLAFLVDHDELTSLKNRSALDRYLSLSLVEQPNQIALLLIDLDNFQEINDALGHEAGDGLLIKVARRIEKLVPAENAFLAKVGGDVFAVCLKGTSKENALVLANRFLHAIDSRFSLDGFEVFISASIGLSFSDESGHDQKGEVSPTDLYRASDSALRQAKESGRNCLRRFEPEQRINVKERLHWLRKLRTGWENQEFTLYYQPKVDLRNGKCIGVEALLRWVDPEEGLLSPAKFLPLAEDTGLIVKIGDWVLREACEQLKYWHKLGFSYLHVAINLSGKQLQHASLIDEVLKAQQDNQLPAEAIELELTEQVFIDNVTTSTQFMQTVRDKGFSLSIDDFGVGYSSLSYLKHFPVDKLKIDRSFITGLPSDKDDVTLVQTIINLAKSMDLNLVAEGIEEVEQLEFLVANGCYFGQGYFFAPPMSAEDFTRFLLNRGGIFGAHIKASND